MRPAEQREQVASLLGDGCSQREIARRLGIPRSTVGYWSRTPDRGAGTGDRPAAWSPEDPIAYCYALGLYLGDGHIVHQGRSARLSISLDARYPRLLGEAERAVAGVFPRVPVRWYRAVETGKTELRISDRSIPLAFPQCGPGRKHHRRIVLTKWQSELTRTHPRALIRGLVHSDGCRTLNRFETTLASGRVRRYEYPRYFFSNLSDDIRTIFCEHCDLLGVRWTLSNPRNVSVSHRDSVALLDTFVGPKS